MKIRLDKKKFVLSGGLSEDEASITYKALEVLEMSEGNFTSRIPGGLRFWTEDGSEIWIESESV